MLASVGASRLDVEAARRIGQRYGVTAIFLGDIAYSEPRIDLKVSDFTKLEGGMRTQIRGDISSRLVETSTGASVRTRSAWRTRQIGSLNVSAEHGVSGAVSQSNPRDEMVPALVFDVTHDFRPTTERQPAR